VIDPRRAIDPRGLHALFASQQFHAITSTAPRSVRLRWQYESKEGFGRFILIYVDE
jgi:hypothetical protein